MAKNKIIFAGETLIDLTGDTVTADKMPPGCTAHDKTGTLITGTSQTYPITPIEYDYNIGYVSNGTWQYENPTRTYTDIYEVQSGHSYLISLGANVGTRFRAMFTVTDIRTITKGNIAGTSIINLNNPAAYSNGKILNVADNGYILVAKDNVGKTGIVTYVYDMTNWP